MRRPAAVLLFFGALCMGQASAPIPNSDVPQRKEILRNHRVTASTVELAPNESTPMHQHDHDVLSVFINGGEFQNTVFGHRAETEKLGIGEVRFRAAGYAHAIKNLGAKPLRVVTVDFADPQGKVELLATSSHYCNPGSTTVCVDEKNLFCTAKVCVEDVTMAPGAITTKHSHPTDHMLVAVSDYELTDEIESKGSTVRSHASGEVEYLNAGLSHRLTNTGRNSAHFTVILWR